MKKHVYLVVLLLATLLACKRSPTRPLTLHTLFADGMVLQQNSVAPIWGEFTAGGSVTVEAGWGERVTGSADVTGKWQLELRTPQAGGPYEVTIATTDSTIVLNNVMSGEVWLASGQSNMQMPVKGWPPRDPIMNSSEEIASANFPDIRMITVPRTTAVQPATSFTGDWQPATPETVGDFSATAYFFARELHQQLNIPIGIIHSSWGGTVAEAWASPEKLATLGDFDDALAMISDPEVIAASEAWFGNRRGTARPNSAADWQSQDWDVPGASTAELQVEVWNDLKLPGRFDEVGSTAVDGAFWLRKTIEIQEVSGSYTLDIGAVDDRDMTYINGRLVGSTMESGKHQEPRSYTVAEGVLQPGTNVITILAIDTGGPGEIIGSISLSNAAEKKFDLSGTWKQRLVGEVYGDQLHVYALDEDLSNRPSVMRIHQNIPTVLYNGMIHPLIPYAIKGAIWYQGESNVGRADQYTRLFPAMITDWRERWGSDFPFYFVQIAPYNYNAPSHLSAALRDAQRRTLALENTGMAVTLDIGNANNIHPGNKQEVGRRLALWALAEDYDQQVVPSGPLFLDAKAQDGSMVISFDYVAEGLVTGDGGLAGFEVAGEDGAFVPASASISGEQVWVSSPRVPSPTAVRYAYTHTSEASLFNSEGLPASSFTSESSLP